MKSLMLLRHAKASQGLAGTQDHDRPLNSRGQYDAPRIAEWIASEGLIPDYIISSTARRARETALAVVELCGSWCDVLLTRSIYEARPEAYVQAIQAAPEKSQRVLVVGHNPTLEMLLETLVGQQETLPTGALAHVRLPIAKWSELQLVRCGDLHGLWRPKELE